MCLYFLIFTVDFSRVDSSLCCFVLVIRGILSFFCNVRIALTCTSEMKWFKQKCDFLACETPKWRVRKYLCPHCTIALKSCLCGCFSQCYKSHQFIHLQCELDKRQSRQSRVIRIMSRPKSSMSVWSWQTLKELQNVPWREEQHCISLHVWTAVGLMVQGLSHSSVRIFANSALMHFEAQGLQIPVLINAPVLLILVA